MILAPDRPRTDLDGAVQMGLDDRIVGTSDPDLLRLLRRAKARGRGRRTDLEPPTESVGRDAMTTGASDYAATRLARTSPEEYAAVQAGERTINAAAVRAGTRPAASAV